MTPMGGIHIENGTDITLSGNSMGACPHCGGVVRLIEGRFSFVDGGVELLAGPQWSQDVLDRLRLTLQRIVQQGPADPIAEVAKVSPEMADALAKATRGWDKNAIMVLIGLILQVLLGGYTVAHDLLDDDGEVVTELRQINRLLQNAERTGNPLPKVGRNEGCPCGSGVKFKRCHGRPGGMTPVAR